MRNGPLRRLTRFSSFHGGENRGPSRLCSPSGKRTLLRGNWVLSGAREEKKLSCPHRWRTRGGGKIPKVSSQGPPRSCQSLCDLGWAKALTAPGAALLAPRANEGSLRPPRPRTPESERAHLLFPRGRVRARARAPRPQAPPHARRPAPSTRRRAAPRPLPARRPGPLRRRFL